MKTTVEGFRKEFSFLSNFTQFNTPWVIKRKRDGLEFTFTFTTVEHFYHACKFREFEIIQRIADHPSKGLKAYIKSLSWMIREDWEERKIDIMKLALKYKFSKANPMLREKLLKTVGTVLVERNTWGDTFWGTNIDTQQGENHLGKLLMDIRENLLNK